MLTRLRLENYRAFEHLDIPLSKINLFFGPNNSGKSAILSVFALLSQTLDSRDREVPLLLNGKFEDLGTYQDVVHGNDSKRDIRVGLESNQQRPPTREEASHANAGFDVTFHYRKQRRETVVKSVELGCALDTPFLGTRVAKTSNNQLIEKVGPEHGGVRVGPISSGSIGLDHFVPYLVPPPGAYRYRGERLRQKYSGYSTLDLAINRCTRNVVSHLRTVEFIGPFRHSPERIYTFSGETPSSVGVHGEKSIDIMVADESRRRGKRLQIVKSISKWLRDSGIAKGVDIVPLSERHYEVQVSHFQSEEQESLADVGYGCSQILPILVAGLSRPIGSSLIIEQPEIHLHPRAQAELGTFFHLVAKRGLQLFIETHSEHLLLRLQSHVASGNLRPNDIAVFYVYAGGKGRRKKAEQLPLGKDGLFTVPWPEGFFPERLREAKRLAGYGLKKQAGERGLA